MGSRNDQLDDQQVELIPKTESIDVDSIKREENGEDFFVATGIVDSLEVVKDSVKEEKFLTEGIESSLESPGIEEEEEPCSSSNVRIILFSFNFKIIFALSLFRVHQCITRIISQMFF